MEEVKFRPNQLSLILEMSFIFILVGLIVGFFFVTYSAMLFNTSQILIFGIIFLVLIILVTYTIAKMSVYPSEILLKDNNLVLIDNRWFVKGKTKEVNLKMTNSVEYKTKFSYISRGSTNTNYTLSFKSTDQPSSIRFYGWNLNSLKKLSDYLKSHFHNIEFNSSFEMGDVAKSFFDEKSTRSRIELT